MTNVTETPTTLPNSDYGYTAYGITVFPLGEDGDLIIAFGHHDKRRFLAACNHHARVACGMKSLADGWGLPTQSEVSHSYGVFEDPDAEWVFHSCKADTPGAIRVTKWVGW